MEINHDPDNQVLGYTCHTKGLVGSSTRGALSNSLVDNLTEQHMYQ
jgi:hypothetical protein